MMQQTSLKIWLELIWWVLTAVVVYVVLYPIHKAMYVWPFELWNILFIVALITFTRYIFLLPHTFLAKHQLAKVVLILLVFPYLFTFIDAFNGFLNYVEEHTWEDLTGHLPTAEKASIESYLWNEMVFFAAGSIIAGPVLAGRLMLSIWRQHNRGTV